MVSIPWGYLLKLNVQRSFISFARWINGMTLVGIQTTCLFAESSAITKISHPTDEWIQRADL
jgi:hypothetical protein